MIKKKPLMEKFKNASDANVLSVCGYKFCIRTITHKEAEFLNEYIEYFYERPFEFRPYAYLLIGEKNVNDFLEDKKLDFNISERMIVLINMICSEVLGIRVKSFDYIVYNSVVDITKNGNALNRFISILIGFGYKKTEIDKLSNTKIIRYALEEIYHRDVFEFCSFVAEISNRKDLSLCSGLEEVICDFLSRNNIADTVISNVKKEFNNGKTDTKVKKVQPYELVREDNNEKDMFRKIPE